MIHKLRVQINKCRTAMAEIGSGTVTVGMDVGPRTRRFLSAMKELLEMLPASEQQLVNAFQAQIKILESQTKIHPFAYGQVQAFLKSLSIRYDDLGARKIFISHSSKDKALIEAFVEKILRLGIGVPADDIFCTSIETMGIKNGDDMRNHIRQNILGCDLALLMISSSYVKSSICLNEMGAVWSLPIPNVNVFVCPDCKLPESIGWLYEVKKADKLCDKQALNRFYEMVTTSYDIEKKVTEWGIQCDAFLNMIHSSTTTVGKFMQRCMDKLKKGTEGSVPVDTVT